MKAEMGIGLWRTKYHTINGFGQFYRDWQPRDETYFRCWHCMALLHRAACGSPSLRQRTPSVCCARTNAALV